MVKGFYFDDDSQTGKQVGWIDDSITDGSIMFVQTGKACDIIIRDSIGTISATAEGATVTVLDVLLLRFF
jgi:hypothetical protein